MRLSIRKYVYRAAGQLRKVVVAAVLLAFGSQAVGLVNLAYAAPTMSTPPLAEFTLALQKLNQTAPQARDILLAISEKAGRGADTAGEIIQLQAVGQTLQDLCQQLQGQLDISTQKLYALEQQGKITSEVITSYESFKNDWKNTVARVLGSLSSLNATSGISLESQSQSALESLQLLSLGRSPVISNGQNKPTKLPHRRSDIPRRDIENRPSIIPGQELSSQADLAPTIEVQLTPDIRSLAAQMNYDPAALFAFVRNTVVFQPYFGSLKGSQGTLLEKAGNDMDQASLFIALLRVSNIPARYVAGVVELPIGKAMNWVGAETSEAAVRAITSNGIPSRLRTSADGTVTHIAFFHVWVEAYIPQGSGRGAANQLQWVQIDPSFKQFDTTSGVDLTAATGFDSNTFSNGTMHGAIIDQVNTSFTHINENFIGQYIRELSGNLQTYAQANLGSSATIGDVLGKRTIRPITRPQLNTLAQSFPFKTFTPQMEFAELPAGFRHSVDFAMAGFAKRFAIPELAGKRITVGYAAATPQDQALIDTFGGIFNVFPAFILMLKPQLKMEDIILAEGSGVQLGSAQILRTSFLRPLGAVLDTSDKIVTTGETYAVILDVQRMPIELFQTRILKLKQMLQSPTTTPEDIRLESIHAAGVGYFAVSDLLSDIQASISKVQVTREPSMAFTAQDLSVSSFYGLPISVQMAGLSIDVTRNIFNPISSSGNADAERAWFLASGAIGSAQEHGIFEQLFNIPAVSTEKLLQVANSRGIPVFTIDRTNLYQVLPQLDTFNIVKQRIIEEVNAGRVAIIPKTNIQYFGYFGTGFIVADLATGAAGYLLAGFVITGGGGTAEVVDAGDKATAEKEVLRGENGGMIAAGALKFGSLLTGMGISAIVGGLLAGGAIGLALGVTGVGLVGLGVYLLATGTSITAGQIKEYNRQIDRAIEGSPP